MKCSGLQDGWREILRVHHGFVHDRPERSASAREPYLRVRSNRRSHRRACRVLDHHQFVGESFSLVCAFFECLKYFLWREIIHLLLKTPLRLIQCIAQFVDLVLFFLTEATGIFKPVSGPGARARASGRSWPTLQDHSLASSLSGRWPARQCPKSKTTTGDNHARDSISNGRSLRM